MAESLKEKRQARRERRRAKNNEEAVVDEVVVDKSITEKKTTATPGRRSGTGTERKTSSNVVVRSFQNIRAYFEGVQSEIQKVTWPTREEAQRLTWIVSAVTLASALFLGGLSILFTELFNIGVAQPWIFITVFVVFIGLLFAYSRYVNSQQSEL